MFSDMYVVEFEPSTNQIVLYSDVGGAVNHTGATVTRDQFVHIAAYRIGSDYYL
jgi:hypothetical protein